MVRAAEFAYEARTEFGDSDWSPPAAVVNSCNIPPTPPHQGVLSSGLSGKYGFHEEPPPPQGQGIAPKILRIHGWLGGANKVWVDGGVQIATNSMSPPRRSDVPAPSLPERSRHPSRISLRAWIPDRKHSFSIFRADSEDGG